MLRCAPSTTSRSRKTSGTDYDFTQIVFRDEADANKAAAEIAGGQGVRQGRSKRTRRTRCRRARSTHVRAAQMPEPLAKALEAMKPGEVSKAPVQTPLGWHVVHLDAIAPHTPPPFEQVKESLRRRC